MINIIIVVNERAVEGVEILGVTVQLELRLLHVAEIEFLVVLAYVQEFLYVVFVEDQIVLVKGQRTLGGGEIFRF